MSEGLTCLVALALAWLGYFVIHSQLASLPVKRWVAERRPGFIPAYRLCYNILAIVLLAPPLWLLFTYPGPALWEWRGALGWVANGLALTAISGFVWSLRYYDGGEFLGLRQLQRGERCVEDQETLHLSPLHRYVRHPWYFFALIILWTRDMNGAMLLTAVAITAYFIIGSRLEEYKLIAYHGAVYHRYMQLVPGLVPLPWKWLRKAEVDRLLGEKV